MTTETNKTETLVNLTPLVKDAVKCWMQVESITQSYNKDWTSENQKAYNLECLLFNHYFKLFTEVERTTYRNFIAYISTTKLYLTDLTTDELYHIYLNRK